MKKYRIRLWELMAERNLKITQVSKDTGLSRPTLNNIKFNRIKAIQMNTIDILCNYFRITPGELFEEVKPIKEVYPTKKQPFKKTTTYKNLQLKNNTFRRKKQVTKDYINKPNPKHYKFELRNVPVIIDGGEIFMSVISDFINKLGDEENGED